LRPPCKLEHMPMTRSEALTELATTFRRFGEVECRENGSPLYEELSHGIADDPEMLALAAEAQQRLGIPNLLFAAVHFLLLSGIEHPLTAHYPGLAKEQPTGSPVYPVFREFCLTHRDRIASLVSSRLSQTNVIRRCACLLPVFAAVADGAGSRELVQIEIGCSAGLNLLWDRYHYDYGSSLTWGDPASPVRLTTELRGNVPIPRLPPLDVVWRMGIDIRPIQLEDEDSIRWLRALIWPEHIERQRRLLAAIELAKKHPPKLVEGDASERLADALREAPPQGTCCVFATHTLFFFAPDAIRRTFDALREHSRLRPVYLVSMEGTGNSHSELKVARFEDGDQTVTHVANCSPHGRWLQWLEAG
jgi:hypothetical protein